MDLKSGYPWWAVKNGLMHAFPPLQADLRCDVAVLGGGITGALIADELSRHGHDVAVIEQRDVGWGSTAASTALLQYEIDTHLVDLAKQYGEADALLAYRACLGAIPMLQALAAEVRDVGFKRADSLYYASKRRHAADLRDEHALRARHGFPVRWLERGAVAERYGFDAPCAILSTVAAEVDPYRFAIRLLMRVQKRGGGVFDRTAIERIETSTRGIVVHAGGCRRARPASGAGRGLRQPALADAKRREQPQQLRLRHRPDRCRRARPAAAHDAVGIGASLPVRAQHAATAGWSSAARTMRSTFPPSATRAWTRRRAR